MKQKLTALLLTLSIVLLLAAAGFFYSHLSTRVEPAQPETLGQEPLASETAAPAESETAAPAQKELRVAPDFTVLDSAGSEVHLSDYAGKPVVLAFWASWCPSCRRELPVFQEVYQELGDQVEFLMVNITTEEASVDRVATFLEEENLSFPVYYDTEGDAMMAYVAYSLPVTYFISADGYIVHQDLGSQTETTLREAIELIYS